MPNTPPAASTSPADASARSLALPPSRRIGIWPTPRKNHAVFGSSKYSALATNVTRRRSTSGRKIESRNDRWFDARITGPRFGTLSRPSTLTRNVKPSTGVSTPFTTQYSKRALPVDRARAYAGSGEFDRDGVDQATRAAGASGSTGVTAS